MSLDEDSDNRFMRAGSIPTSWRDARRIFRVSLDDPAPFLDVESPETRAHLDSALSSLITDHLDVSDVRGRNRMLTRAIAEWAYTQVDGDGDGVYSGIRYMSRHGDYECWAIFSGTSVREAGPATAIELTDPDLIRVARSFALTIN